MISTMNSPAHSIEDDTHFAGLDLLSSAVILLDNQLRIRHCNPAAENLFAASQRVCLGRPSPNCWARRPH